MQEGDVNPKAVQKLMSGDFSDSSEKIQCFSHCFLLKLGLIDVSGNIITSAIINELSTDSDKEKVTNSFKKCKSEKEVSACEKAYKAFKCYYTNVIL